MGQPDEMPIRQLIQSTALDWFRVRPRDAYVLTAKKKSRPLLGPQSRLGGFPFLPKVQKWPLCPRCGMSLFFVGQFGRDLETLPLPKRFTLLSMFKCSNMDCDSWSARLGGRPFFQLL